MAVAIKCALVVFMVIGAALAAYGAWEIWETKCLVRSSSGKAPARFAGYHREFHRVPSGLSLKGSGIPSVASYPELTYRAADGTMQSAREPKVHVLPLYKSGQIVEVLLFAHGPPRLAGFYSLYMRDLLILLMGLGFFLLAFCFWNYALPLFSSAQSAGLPEAPSPGTPVVGPEGLSFQRFLDQRIGPVSARFVLIASGIFMGSALAVILVAGLAPYWAQMHFGAGARLMDALREGRVEEARQRIAKGSGLHARNEFGQSPLLLALETGQMDLARMLIKAGADVNIRSKMLMTPLRVAAESGNLEMVKLLLASGAWPQHPDDRAPPFLYAMANGHDEIARVLIEGGTDLHRRYPLTGRTGTVGDLAVLAGRRELVELIRRRGGTFTLTAE